MIHRRTKTHRSLISGNITSKVTLLPSVELHSSSTKKPQHKREETIAIRGSIRKYGIEQLVTRDYSWFLGYSLFRNMIHIQKQANTPYVCFKRVYCFFLVSDKSFRSRCRYLGTWHFGEAFYFADAWT